jgi:hypothetical protein
MNELSLNVLFYAFVSNSIFILFNQVQIIIFLKLTVENYTNKYFYITDILNNILNSTRPNSDRCSITLTVFR